MISLGCVTINEQVKEKELQEINEYFEIGWVIPSDAKVAFIEEERK